MIDPDNPLLAISRQGELLDFPRSTYYFHPNGASEEELELTLTIDKYHLEHAGYGSRRTAKEFGIGRERAKRLMRIMGLESVYPKPRTTYPKQGHKIYPYLLRGLEITGPNHVWSTDITCIPMAKCFVYLTAVIDWHSRYILLYLSSRFS